MLNMGQMGRYGDNTMAHVSTGEMIVPQEVLDKRPDLKTGIMAALSQEGLNPDRYTVGSGINSINPATGQPEFFNLKKLLKFAAPFLLGPAIGSLLGGLGTTIVSLHSSTILATLLPNNFLILIKVFRPPWSSTASCNKPPIASSVVPPSSMTLLLTETKWVK